MKRNSIYKRIGVAGYIGTCFSVSSVKVTEQPKESPKEINKTKKDNISKQRGNSFGKEKQTFNK